MSFLYALENIRNPVMNAFFSALTFLGSEWIIVAAAVCVFWCFQKKAGYYLMATGIIGTVANQLMKIICQVPRPWMRDENFTIVESARADAGGYSFPSGHTQNAVAVIGGIARFTRRKSIRIVCIVLVVLVAFSRMYLGVHTPADVGAALLIGLILVFVLYPVFQRSEEKPHYVIVVFAAATGLSLFAALFTELYPWSSGTDGENLAEAAKNIYTMLGCSVGILIAAPIERKYIHFDANAPWWAQILKIVFGLAAVVILRAVLKNPLLSLFGGHEAAHAVRYCIIVLFAVLVWPLTFPWFAKGCPMGQKAKRH